MCNELHDSLPAAIIKIAFGLVVIIITLAKGFFAELNSDLAAKKDPEVNAIDALDENKESYEDHVWLNFHAVMCIGGMAYLIMSVTNWAAVDDSIGAFSANV